MQQWPHASSDKIYFQTKNKERKAKEKCWTFRYYTSILLEWQIEMNNKSQVLDTEQRNTIVC